MFFRIRNAFGLGILLALVTFMEVFAKGQYSFIAITGPGIDGEIRTADSSLTSDFFAFADFYRNKVEAPLDPGHGYEITRYYLEGKREDAFDKLHYYPDTGFVFYDGIVNGDSEYDEKWYSANPAIKSIFEDTLPAAPLLESSPAQPQGSVGQASAKLTFSQFVMPAAMLAGLAILFWLINWRRKPTIQ
jgi:hypothetical protein